MKCRRPVAFPITIGHAVYAFTDGGVENELLNLVNHGNRDRFHHVILCFTQAGAPASQITSPVCEVIELNKKNGNDLRLPGRIAAAIRQRRIDIIHARNWPTLVETALATRLTRVHATIYAFHGKVMQDLQSKRLQRRLMQKLMVRFYDHVMTLNRRMQADLAAEYSLAEDRIRIIASGVDVGVFRPREDQRALRVAFGLPTERFIIGNVARLDPIKNHEVMLRALKRLREHGQPPFLLLVGDGPERNMLIREIERLQLTEDVRLIGYSHRVPELLNCMDLYVQSSFYEGHSNAVIEAMACGLPVLATDVGGTPELFSEGQEGILFRPEDDKTLSILIRKLQCDSSLWCTMAKRARSHVVAHLSVETMVNNYEAMYLELVAPANRHRN